MEKIANSGGYDMVTVTRLELRKALDNSNLAGNKCFGVESQ